MNRFLRPHTACLGLRTVVMLLALALLLTGCPNQPKKNDLDETLRNYEQMIRWSQWEGAVNFIAPEYLLEHPITQLDIDRLNLFRVTNYTVRSTTPINEGMGILQTVEIRLFHKSQAREFAIRDSQEWRYDEEAKRWFLHHGLPDVTQGR